MKRQIQVTLFALSMLSAAALAQCAKPEMNPVWDTDKQQFKCVASAGAEGSQNDGTVSPRGDKAFCNSARENLLKACPASGDKTCKNKAKSIFNSCYKDNKAQSDSDTGSTSTTRQGMKTDPSVCMQTFAQQQQACQSRKLPPPAAGQPSAPDTCLQDAMTAQNACLTKNR